MEECLFCKIARGEIPSRKVYEDERLLAIWDIKPQAPVHLLIMPKEHVKDVLDYTSHEATLMDSMMRLAAHLARTEGIAHSGFRLVMNCGRDAGQSVDHLHMHVLGGREMALSMA